MLPGAGGGRKWLAVAPAVVVLAWGGNQFLPLLQLYRQLDGFTQVQVDLLLATYVLGIVPGFVLSGALSDRYGRKPVLLAGLGLGIVGSVILALSASSPIGLGVGRLVSGASVAAGMVVGTSWIKELSARAGRSEAGARRASVALTLGFGGGAGIGGALAQWGPWPAVLPYVVQIVASLVAAAGVVRAIETRNSGLATNGLLRELRVPRRVRPRFLRVVLPLAPWVFAAPALAFAVGPSLVSESVRGFTVGFATLMTVLTLAFGWVTQLVSAPILAALRGRAAPVGAVAIAVGALLLIAAAETRDVWPVVVAAPVFGIGYGLSMVAGLTTVQGMSTPDELAGMTAIFYSITYAGFLLPAILAALSESFPLWTLFVATSAVCLACALAAALASGTGRDRAA